MKKIVVITVLVLLLAPAAWPIEKTPPASSSAVVDAGNKFCPVSGDKVSGKDFVEYKGKRFGLCCKQCAGKFKKNPEKYIAKLAGQSEGVSEMEHHQGEREHEHAGHEH